MLTAASVTPASRSAGTWARRIGSSPCATCSALSRLRTSPAAEFGTAPPPVYRAFTAVSGLCPASHGPMTVSGPVRTASLHAGGGAGVGGGDVGDDVDQVGDAGGEGTAQRRA